MASVSIHDEVKDYYGKRIKNSSGMDKLQSTVCFIRQNSMTNEFKEALELLHPEVVSKYVDSETLNRMSS